MTPDQQQKVARQIARLAVASDCFQQCLSLLKHIQELNLDEDSDIWAPMFAGVVTTYARSFISAEGLGPLAASYSKFPDTRLDSAHKKMIEARNMFYAHQDITHSKKHSKSSTVPIRVFVNLKPTLDGFLFTPMLVELSLARLPDIVELIQFQLERLIKDLSTKNSIIIDFDRPYDLDHTYELGVDFP
jgi:hypothetical protein